MLTKLSMRTFVVGGFLLLGLTSCIADVGTEDESVTEDEVLGPPASVTVTPTSVDRVTVSWTAVPGAVKYYIYQQTGTTGPIAQVNSARAPATTLPVAHLTPNTQYCFYVATEDGTGPGVLSTSSCGTTQTGPVAPSPIIVEQTTPTKITVRWTAVSNAQKYYVFHSAALTGTYSYTGTTLAPGTSFIQTVATGTHCYKLQTQAATGTSSQTGAICNNSPQPPTGVTVTRTSSGRLRVAWTKAVGVTKTYGFESRAGTPYVLRTSTLGAASQFFDRSGLTPGVQYCYELQSQFGTNDNGSPRSGLTIPVCGVP